MREIILKYKPAFILSVIPLLFTLLFGYVLSPIFVEPVPFVVYDMDMSANSRQLAESFRDSAAFDIREDVSSYQEIEELLVDGKIGGALILPEGFGESLLKKEGAEATVLVDGSNFLVCSAVQLASTTIILMANANVQLQYLEAGAMAPLAAEQNIYTMNLVDRRLYNPQTCYLYYLFAGLLGLFVQQTILATVPGVLIDEKHRVAGAGCDMCPARDEARSSGFARGIRRFLPQLSGEVRHRLFRYMLLSLIGILLCLIVLHTVFAYPINGNIFYVLLIQLIFEADMIAVSFVIAAFFDVKVHVSQFTMLLSIPTMLCCGYGWPEYMMPTGFAPVMKAVWPLYYYANPLKELMLKGAGMDAIGHYVAGGVLYAVVWLTVGSLLYARKTRRLSAYGDDFAEENSACDS